MTILVDGVEVRQTLKDFVEFGLEELVDLSIENKEQMKSIILNYLRNQEPESKKAFIELMSEVVKNVESERVQMSSTKEHGLGKFIG